jgi:SAM-dependent methyltransferase
VDTITQVKVTKSGEAQWHQTGQLLANARGGPDTGTGAIGGMRVAVQNSAGAVGANVASHDRVKPRLLSPSDPFLRAVGVSTADGKSIKASRRDKYKQVEEFVKLVKLAVEDAQTGGHLKTPAPESPARLVDLGCGNAYLTFGAYAHLSSKSSSKDTDDDAPFHMEVVGVDIKKQSRETNTRVAAELGWDEKCVFVEGAIADADVSSSFATKRGEREEAVDIVLALHACDTATDEAIARAVRWRAPLTLVAPCCHHDLQVRMKRAAKNTSGPAAPAAGAARHPARAAGRRAHGCVSRARAALARAQGGRHGVDRGRAHAPEHHDQGGAHEPARDPRAVGGVRRARGRLGRHAAAGGDARARARGSARGGDARGGDSLSDFV